MAIQLNHRTNTITTGSNAETAGVTLVINNTGSLTLPKGTTAQRPSSAVAGDFRYNTTDNKLEYYNGTQWIPVIAGNVEDLKDTNGNFIVDGVSVGGSVANYVQISNASASSTPKIASTGSDTDVGLDFVTKGSGNFKFSDAAGDILTLQDGGAANVTIKGGATKATVTASGDLEVTTTTGNFRVSDGTNVGLIIDVSGANGVTLEAGGSEAKLFTAGDFFIHSTGGDVRIGNGTTIGLVIDTNTVGATVTLQTIGTGATLFVSADKSFKFNASDFDFSGKVLKNVATPTQATDAANKQYVDSVVAGLDWKQSVRAATTVNITLSGIQTVDGVSLVSGDRVLVKNQTNASENGIYVVLSSAWSRAEDADENSEVTAGLAVFVEEGTTNANTGWLLVTDNPIVLGTTNLTFTQFNGAASFSISGDDGIIATQNGNVWTIEADTDETTITRGTGGSGQLSVYAGTGVNPGSVLRAPSTTPGIAQWGALDLANSNAVTNVLPEANGGTGESTYTQGDILVGDASNGLTKLGLGNNKTFLKSNGTTLVYASAQINDIDEISVTSAIAGQVLTFNGTKWVNDAVDLSDSDAVKNVLGVSNGGTGLNTVASGAIVYGDGTSALKTLAIGAASDSNTAYVLKTNATGNAPEWGSLTFNQLSDVTLTSAASGQIVVFDGTVWKNEPLTNVDQRVRVSNTDTNSGFLNEKLVAAANGAVTFTIVNAGGDEDYTLAVNVDSATIRINSSNNLAVGGGLAGQVLLGQGTNTDAVWSYLNVLRNGVSGGIILKVSGDSTVPVTLVAATAQSVFKFESQDAAITTKGGRVSLNDIKFPVSAPAESILVTQSSANDLVALKAGGNDDKLLLWNGTVSAFQFVSAEIVGGDKFQTIAFTGNYTGNNIVADQFADTLTINAGDGIRITSVDTTDTFTIEFSNAGLTDTAVVSNDTVPFFDSSNANQPEFRSFANIFADLDVPNGITVNGFIVRTSADTYASRTIVAKTSADQAGITVNNGDGVAGNPEIGLDINGLTAITSVVSADQLVIYSTVNDANRKVTVTDLFNAFDKTRINDAANTTYVDTDEIANSVNIVAGGGEVARFVNGTAGSAQFVMFDTGTSAGTVRIVASGTSTNIDFRFVPKGTGQVFIGDTGDGVIQADDTFNLALHGGNNGGNVIIKGGANTGTVRIQSPTSAEFVAFKDNHSIVHYSSAGVSAKKTDFIFTGITTNATTTTIGSFAVESDSTVLFEGYVVARDATATDTSKSAGYKFTGVAANVGGVATLVDSNISEVLAEGSAAINYSADFVTNSGNVEIRVTGGATDNVKWVAFVKVVSVTH